MNRVTKYLWPQTKLGKFVRDLGVMTAIAALGYLLDNWTGFVGAINDASGNQIPAFLLAWAYSLALLASRWLRERS